MVYICNICGEIYNLHTAVSFHSIPKNKRRRLIWLKSIGKKIKNFKAPSWAKICSQHFTQDSFYLSIDGKRRHLKTSAVPTLFHITRPTLEIYPENESHDTYENLQYDKETKPTIKVVSSTMTTQSDTVDEIHNLDVACETLSTSKTVPQTETQYISSERRGNVIFIDKENSQNYNKLQKQLQEANARNAMLQQKLTCLQQKNKRFEERLLNLLTLLRHFYKRTKCYQKMLVRYSNKVINNTL